VVFSAHWDHPRESARRPFNGDAIYNGAIDNATGCAVLIELARGVGPRCRRTPGASGVVPLVHGREERAARFRVLRRACPVPRRQNGHRFGITTRCIPLAAPGDVGAHRRRADHGLAAGAADRQTLNLEVSSDRGAGAGPLLSAREPLLIRARRECPAFSIAARHRIPGKPAGYGHKMWEEYNSRHYHQTLGRISRRIGISRRSGRPPSTAFRAGLGDRQPRNKLPGLAAAGPVPPPVSHGPCPCPAAALTDASTSPVNPLSTFQLARIFIR